MSKELKHTCDGSCPQGHRGEVKKVVVEKWGIFYYCEEAIYEDERRGLKVTIINNGK